jgi:integrase
MIGAAMDVTLKHIVRDIDRHGNVRIYVRLPGKPKIRIREQPGTAAFLDAYLAAIAGPEAGQAKAGSFKSLCLAYYNSETFKALDKATREWRRSHLERICVKHGDKPYARMERRHVRDLRNEVADKPTVANTRLAALKALFAWAEEDERVPQNPTIGVKPIRYQSAGFHTWTMEEVEQYEKRHPIGTKARLAMALLLYTAGRREDAVRLGPQHMRNGRIRFIQAKNEHRKPVHVDLPLPNALSEIIRATPTGHLAFLVTAYGKPYTFGGFGNKMRQWCDEAGLPQCSAHGLRKAAATRLAEHGATEHEIMAVTGHQTTKEVERYTKAARRARMADNAVAKIEAGTSGGPTANGFCPTAGQAIVRKRQNV